MKKLTGAIKQMLDALAFEHAGEHMSMKDKTQILAQSSNSVNEAALKELQPSLSRSGSSSRRVALYMGSELPPEVMGYVIETCSRLKHQLTVLSFQSEYITRELLSEYQHTLEETGVEMEVVALSGDPVSGLGRYLRKHPEIAFLTCRDTGYLGRRCLKGKYPQNAFPVPVVVVTTVAEDAGVQSEAASTDDSGEVVVA